MFFRKLNNLKVKDIMNPKVITIDINKELNLYRVISEMLEEDVEQVLIKNEKKNSYQILTYKEILQLINQNEDEFIVSENDINFKNKILTVSPNVELIRVKKNNEK
ncbi:hypothetical protein [Sporohalobacter salinus]|uniref:hypothetical protein n=1 Tax=Sporohalobacter salinus TaxID=1494606 RepID=UPI001962152F|nr:hypothetical protein [Sporohalobacter salinus]MBM7622529.1 Mg2+/Co2+ transporter CorC [Sporohalobacter salinus]